LPPLAEQQRIVAKVEALLVRVNTARQRLTKVPAILKRYRQSVLAAACDGRLTEDWRLSTDVRDADEDLGQSIDSNETSRSKAEPTEGREVLAEAIPESWRLPRVEDVFRLIDYRGKNPKKAAQGKRLITAKNIRIGYLSEEPVEYVSDAVYESWMTRGLPRKG